MGASVIAGVGGSLLAAAIERFYDSGREKLEDLNRQADISEDLDALETEFQRALRERISDAVEGPESNPLVAAVDAWDPIVHELYGIESAAPTPEAVEKGEHDRLLFESKTEAVERIVQAWAGAAGVDLDKDPTLERMLREAVAEAYPRAFAHFVDRISGDALADVFEMETLRVIQTRLDDLAAEYEGPKVYKTLDEFRASLFDPHRYVPIAAELEFESRFDNGSARSVEDAKEAVMELLDDGVGVIKVYGEGGSGKSRLLAAVGEAIREADDREVYYVTNPEKAKPPNLERDTVLFVDDAGRKDMDYFIRRSARSERTEANQEHTVQVVAAARSVYEEAVEEVINERPYLRASTLRLKSLDGSRARRLIEEFDADFDDRTFNYIIETARGNPFFVTLLAQLVIQEGSPESNMRRAFEKVVGRMIGADVAAVSESEESGRRTFNALAVWQTYDEPEDADLLSDIVPAFENRIARREWLRELARERYLDWHGSIPTNATYSLRHDVLADYLCFEMLASKGEYRDYAEGVLDSKAPEVAESLVELIESPLRPFYSDLILKRVRNQAEWLAEAVLQRRCDVHLIFETEIKIALAFPEFVPEERLAVLLEDHGHPEELLEPVVRLVFVFLQWAEKNSAWLANFDRWLVRLNDIYVTSGKGLEPLVKSLYNSVKYNGEAKRFEEVEERLNQLHDLYDSSSEKLVRNWFAKALHSSLGYYGEAEQFEQVEVRLAQLEELHEVHLEEPIRESLAKALNNVVYDYGEAAQFEKMEARLAQLSEFYLTYPEESVRKELAKALNNVIYDYGEAGRLNDLNIFLTQLDEVHEAHPERAIREPFALALLSAVDFYVEAKKFDQMEKCLTRFDKLHEDYPEGSVCTEFAKSLFNAVIGYGEEERFEEMEEHLTRLEDVHATHPKEPVRTEFAEALFNAFGYYADAGRFEEMDMCLARLDELHETHPEETVRKWFAMTLINAVEYCGENERFVEAQTHLTRLAELHETHPEQSVRKCLAIALINGVNHNSEAGRFETVESRLARLRELATIYEDFGGFAKEDQFFEITRIHVLRLIDLDEELAKELLDIIQIVLNETKWIRFSGEIDSKLYQKYMEDEISAETYQHSTEYLF